MAQSLHIGPFPNLPFSICAIYFDLKVIFSSVLVPTFFKTSSKWGLNLSSCHIFFTSGSSFGSYCIQKQMATTKKNSITGSKNQLNPTQNLPTIKVAQIEWTVWIFPNEWNEQCDWCAQNRPEIPARSWVFTVVEFQQKKCFKKSFCRGSFLNMKSRRPFYPTKKRFQLEKKDVILSRCVVWFHPASWSSNHSIGKWYHPQSYNLSMCVQQLGGGKERSLFDVDFFPFNLQLRLPFLELVTKKANPTTFHTEMQFFWNKNSNNNMSPEKHVYPKPNAKIGRNKLL